MQEPSVLYEDNDVVAINKPAGLVVHSDGKTKEANLVDWLVENYPKIKDVGEPGRDSHGNEILRSGIVHRLDRGTSGVMLIAKTKESFESLKKQFQNHKIQKKYEAFVFGEVRADGVVDRPIGRSSSDFRKWSAQRGARGEMRDAVTEYRVLTKNKDFSLIELSPKTGRTHQIRVHMKAINHPLVGDSLYAPNREMSLGFNRVALHSKEITFTGLDGTTHTVSAPYPEDFQNAMKLINSERD
ncbi:MAG: RluA family pseudouridine synthase [Minisyncoccia bacterium]